MIQNNNKLLKLFNTRLNLIFIPIVLNLTLFFLTRVFLLFSSLSLFNHTIENIFFIFFIGFVYDLAYCTYFALIPTLVLIFLPQSLLKKKYTKFCFLITLFIFSYSAFFITISEYFFWDEFSVRFNFIAVDYLVYTNEVIENIYESYPLIKIIFAIFAISFVGIYKSRNYFYKILLKTPSLRYKISVLSALTLLIAIFSIFLNQSLRELNTNNYIKELASNGPYQFVAAFKANTLEYKRFYIQGNDQELSKILKKAVGKKNNNGNLYDVSREIVSKKTIKKLNVILISIESLSAKYLTRFGYSNNVTPYMDEWFKQGLFFSNFYATGTRTTRGLEAISLAIPPTPGRSIVKRPDNAKMHTLGKVFKDNGYDVAFLYGGRGFFDNMNAFFSGNGYRIVDESNINSADITFKNAWGVCDGDLYKQAIMEANKSVQKNKPFFYHIMTTSNHRPYTYPSGKIDIPSGSQRAGAVKYTDYALREFINTAKTQTWFDDTVFVVLADHCGQSAGRVGLPIKKYHIPLFIYAPKYIISKEIKKVSSQIDLAPTLLAILNFSYKSYFMGRNILSNDFEERALIGNYQKLAMYKDKKLIILSPQKKIQIIENPWTSKTIKNANSSLPLVKQTMSFYQGSDYILKHKMNRYK